MGRDAAQGTQLPPSGKRKLLQSGWLPGEHGDRDSRVTLTLSPGGPWGPSPPDVPCRETESEELLPASPRSEELQGSWAKGQTAHGALPRPLTLAPDFPVAPRGPR